MAENSIMIPGMSIESSTKRAIPLELFKTTNNQLFVDEVVFFISNGKVKVEISSRFLCCARAVSCNWLDFKYLQNTAKCWPQRQAHTHINAGKVIAHVKTPSSNY